MNDNNDKGTIAPVALFVYNRVAHTRRTIESLSSNHGASNTDLIIFSDGPKNDSDEANVGMVRAYLEGVTGFRSVVVHPSKENKGLASSIIDGVSTVLAENGKVIVLEDDMETSPHFLNYMNDALTLYENETKVISVHGYIYPCRNPLPDYFFLRGAHCWGWATWRRGWNLYEPDGSKLLARIVKNNGARDFDYDHAYPFTKMLEDQIAGLNQSWAIRWHATAFINNMLTLYPGKSFVNNIGLDGSGVHSIERDVVYNVSVREDYAGLPAISAAEDLGARKEVIRFFKSVKPTITERIINKLKRLFQ